DCLYLDQKTRRCTIYTKRPDTCRNHPQIGPRPGYCAFGYMSRALHATERCRFSVCSYRSLTATH
ncbi:MAG: YkgJ family cysteine cluster protein, partial [Desulfobulbaceae bacterium]|nr:YkgJ family cysteine cluster protein [Desulfobulbaceae bacterium]